LWGPWQHAPGCLLRLQVRSSPGREGRLKLGEIRLAWRNERAERESKEDGQPPTYQSFRDLREPQRLRFLLTGGGLSGKPYAVVPHVRICAGGDQQWSFLPRQLTHRSKTLREPETQNSVLTDPTAHDRESAPSFRHVLLARSSRARATAGCAQAVGSWRDRTIQRRDPSLCR
jgi:hypothetical protein